MFYAIGHSLFSMEVYNFAWKSFTFHLFLINPIFGSKEIFLKCLHFKNTVSQFEKRLHCTAFDCELNPTFNLDVIDITRFQQTFINFRPPTSNSWTNMTETTNTQSNQCLTKHHIIYTLLPREALTHTHAEMYLIHVSIYIRNWVIRAPICLKRETNIGYTCSVRSE